MFWMQTKSTPQSKPTPQQQKPHATEPTPKVMLSSIQKKSGERFSGSIDGALHVVLGISSRAGISRREGITQCAAHHRGWQGEKFDIKKIPFCEHNSLVLMLTPSSVVHHRIFDHAVVQILCTLTCSAHDCSYSAMSRHNRWL